MTPKAPQESQDASKCIRCEYRLITVKEIVMQTYATLRAVVNHYTPFPIFNIEMNEI